VPPVPPPMAMPVYMSVQCCHIAPPSARRSPFQLKVGTPVTLALGKVYANFGSSA